MPTYLNIPPSSSKRGRGGRAPRKTGRGPWFGKEGGACPPLGDCSLATGLCATAKKRGMEWIVAGCDVAFIFREVTIGNRVASFGEGFVFLAGVGQAAIVSLLIRHLDSFRFLCPNTSGPAPDSQAIICGSAQLIRLSRKPVADRLRITENESE